MCSWTDTIEWREGFALDALHRQALGVIGRVRALRIEQRVVTTTQFDPHLTRHRATDPFCNVSRSIRLCGSEPAAFVPLW